MTDLTRTPAWQALLRHHAEMQPVQMLQLFAVEPKRFENFSMDAAGLFLDYSKNRITGKTLELLNQLVEQQQVAGKIAAMFAGEEINNTESRPALHVALRHRGQRKFIVNAKDVMPDVHQVLEQMRSFSVAVRNGDWRGYTNQAITDVVNIGIGGSDLGPLMVTEALKKYGHDRLNMHFVSNVDATHISEVFLGLNPETTLFIVASKTFTTQETLANAHSARQWLLDHGADTSAIAKHFVALSTNREAVSDFGIDPANMFVFWDWVGGRYSLWSAIGLSIALYVGMDRFEQLLAGASDMDEHFRTAPVGQNMPVLLAQLSVWYSNFFAASSHLIAPYDQYLHRFPAYLQQLTMESNGKSVTKSGEAVDYSTEPVVWGEPGTNGQHAFFQLVHQGTHLIPADFIIAVESLNPLGEHQSMLLANCFAQTEALMRGKSAQELTLEMQAAGTPVDEIERMLGHRSFAGNRPTNTLLINRLDAHALGALIALYEHKVFVEAAIWDINPFDQWGVELGKQLAKNIYAELQSGGTATSHDASTNGLINRVTRQRNLLA